MSSAPLIPKQAAIAVADMVDNCAKVKPGMNVLIIAANDGLHGGVNIVDQETVAWLHAAVIQRGADATSFGATSLRAQQLSGEKVQTQAKPGRCLPSWPTLCVPPMW